VIGSLGDTVFEVTPDVIRTFSGASRSVSARYEEHAVHLRKPVSEFTGPDLDEVRFSVRLDEEYGVDVMAEIDRLRDACIAGEVLPLILGDRLVMDCTLRDVSESWRHVTPSGRVTIATVDVTVLEYV